MHVSFGGYRGITSNITQYIIWQWFQENMGVRNGSQSELIIYMWDLLEHDEGLHLVECT